MACSSSRPMSALVNSCIPSSLRRRVQRKRGHATRGAPTQQERMVSTEGEGKTLDEVQVPAGMRIAAAGVSEHVTASDSVEAPASLDFDVSSSSSNGGGVSGRIGRLMQMRSEHANTTELEIEASREHWSELDPSSDEDDGNLESDSEVFGRLQEKWGGFFHDWGGCLVPGEKIAEGGQAEIFVAEYPSAKGDRNSVLKVFKEGYRLRDLERQWPLDMIQHSLDYEGAFFKVCCCMILGATLLKNGRFAFRMWRYWGDLRKLIDIRMQHNGNQRPPFSKQEVIVILRDIASGMLGLHELNIIHRDLKAANILVKGRPSMHQIDPRATLASASFKLADYECSVGVVGTGYWRAPEILRAVQERDIKPELFTEKSDVYGFAMTCYEVLTGCVPFEELGPNCYDIVLNGKRPNLPGYVDRTLRLLLGLCWHTNPVIRPSSMKVYETLIMYR